MLKCFGRQRVRAKTAPDQSCTSRDSQPSADPQQATKSLILTIVPNGLMPTRAKSSSGGHKTEHARDSAEKTSNGRDTIRTSQLQQVHRTPPFTSRSRPTSPTSEISGRGPPGTSWLATHHCQQGPMSPLPGVAIVSELALQDRISRRAERVAVLRLTSPPPSPEESLATQVEWLASPACFTTILCSSSLNNLLNTPSVAVSVCSGLKESIGYQWPQPMPQDYTTFVHALLQHTSSKALQDAFNRCSYFAWCSAAQGHRRSSPGRPAADHGLEHPDVLPIPIDNMGFDLSMMITPFLIKSTRGAPSQPALFIEHLVDRHEGILEQHLRLKDMLLEHADTILTVCDLQGQVLHQNAASIHYAGNRMPLLLPGSTINRSYNYLSHLFQLESDRLDELLEELATGCIWAAEGMLVPVSLHQSKLLALARAPSMDSTTTVAMPEFLDGCDRNSASSGSWIQSTQVLSTRDNGGGDTASVRSVHRRFSLQSMVSQAFNDAASVASEGSAGRTFHKRESTDSSIAPLHSSRNRRTFAGLLRPSPEAATTPALFPISNGNLVSSSPNSFAGSGGLTNTPRRSVRTTQSRLHLLMKPQIGSSPNSGPFGRISTGTAAQAALVTPTNSGPLMNIKSTSLTLPKNVPSEPSSNAMAASGNPQWQKQITSDDLPVQRENSGKDIGMCNRFHSEPQANAVDASSQAIEQAMHDVSLIQVQSASSSSPARTLSQFSNSQVHTQPDVCFTKPQDSGDLPSLPLSKLPPQLQQPQEPLPKPECQSPQLPERKSQQQHQQQQHQSHQIKQQLQQQPEPQQSQEQQVDVPGRWHDIKAWPTVDPTTGAMLVVISQADVTERRETQAKFLKASEACVSLLELMFPRHVIEHLTVAPAISNGTENNANHQPDASFDQLATKHECVTLFFCDIVGFTTMSKEVEPVQVMQFLNALYTTYDHLVDKFGIYKVETVGDCYVVAGGLMVQDEEGFACVDVENRNDGASNALAVYRFAQAVLRVASSIVMPHNNQPVRVRIGLHSGPITSGIIGQRMPKFCLFGDSMNTCSRMETTAPEGSIHLSQATYELLRQQNAADELVCTGGVDVKGKGRMVTYTYTPPSSPPIPDLVHTLSHGMMPHMPQRSAVAFVQTLRASTNGRNSIEFDVNASTEAGGKAKQTTRLEFHNPQTEPSAAGETPRRIGNVERGKSRMGREAFTHEVPQDQSSTTTCSNVVPASHDEVGSLSQAPHQQSPRPLSPQPFHKAAMDGAWTRPSTTSARQVPIHRSGGSVTGLTHSTTNIADMLKVLLPKGDELSGLGSRPGSNNGVIPVSTSPGLTEPPSVEAIPTRRHRRQSLALHGSLAAVLTNLQHVSQALKSNTSRASPPPELLNSYSRVASPRNGGSIMATMDMVLGGSSGALRDAGTRMASPQKKDAMMATMDAIVGADLVKRTVSAAVTSAKGARQYIQELGRSMR